MAVSELRSRLTAEERLQKRQLIVRDLISFLTLFAVTAFLAVLTYYLFNSFSQRRRTLAQNWLEQGEKAVANGQPEQAVDAFRTALEYDPGQRDTEIKLAMALSAAGRTDESTAYFNTLLESEPGNGIINLELARLAVKQKSESRAIDYYQRALDGKWQGDGYERRRTVRLELARYLIDQKDYSRARTQLLIAAGNAPDDPKVKLEIAQLMEKAQDPVNALEIYRSVSENTACPIQALEGAGRMAFSLGRFELARKYLEKVVDHPDFSSEPESVRTSNREMLAETNQLLDLFPGSELKVTERSERVLHAAKTAQSRLDACLGMAAVPVASLVDLSGKWQQLPVNLTATKLARDPEMQQTIMDLIYDSEKQTSQVCGAPTGEDALLLKVAQAPSAVEQQ
jgi:Tfp pilus assembly protein PilF